MKNETDTKTCPNEATYRYTWPGRDESYICEQHAGWLRQLTAAMGAYQQLIPIQPNQDIKCRQVVE
jgi:hypothetical protein